MASKKEQEKNPLIYLGAACLILLIAIFGLILYRILVPSALTKEDCYKLGSNERMEACLLEVNQRDQTPSTTFDTSLLSLTDQNMEGNTYMGLNPTFSATIKNNGSTAANNVVAKFKFFPYSQANGNCTDDSKDTVYVKLTNIILPGDSQTVKQAVPTNFDTSGRFSWCAEIFSATN